MDVLTAFANGLTAMTGVEAVSNAVPLFQKPTVRNAQWTLTIIVVTLAVFNRYRLLMSCLSYCSYESESTWISDHIVAIGYGDHRKRHFYYISIVSIFVILAYSAQTSFSGFPRVCRLLAEDNYLPYFC